MEFSNQPCNRCTWKKNYFLPTEVVVHNCSSDCWVSYLGGVYDLTEICNGWSGTEEIKPILAQAGKDISHWFDHCRSDIRHYVHPITGVSVPYCPHGPIPDINPSAPTSTWRPLDRCPWWLNEHYKIGYLTKNARPCKIINVLAGVQAVISRISYYIRGSYPGKDISHWFDHCRSDIRHYVHPITGVSVPYCPHGPIPDINPSAPTSTWRPLDRCPWWLNEHYKIGYLTKNARPCKIINVLAGVQAVISRISYYIRGSYPGKDISHWFDHCRSDIRHYVHPITGVSVPYCPHGPIPDINPSAPTSTWRPLDRCPWWLNEHYKIGYLTKNARPCKIINVLAGVQAVISVCEEDNIARIQERFLGFNGHGASYTWKFGGETIDLDCTLTENGLPDERDRFIACGLPDDVYIPCILCYYNDDLSVDSEHLHSADIGTAQKGRNIQVID